MKNIDATESSLFNYATRLMVKTPRGDFFYLTKTLEGAMAAGWKKVFSYKDFTIIEHDYWEERYAVRSEAAIKEILRQVAIGEVKPG